MQNALAFYAFKAQKLDYTFNFKYFEASVFAKSTIIPPRLFPGMAPATMTVNLKDIGRIVPRILRTLCASAAILVVGNACIFGPETVGIVEVDHPPYIDPQAVSPSTSDEPSVVFNLADPDRSRQFQVLGVYDWDANELLTYAFVLRIGAGQQISIPPATEVRPRLRVSQDQTTPYTTRFESSHLSFDPCSYRDVTDGTAKHGSIQIVIYDTIDTSPPLEGFEGEAYIVRWTWPLEFHGLCPLCSNDSQCFDDEQCVGGVCVPS